MNFAPGSCALLFKIECVQRCMSQGAHKALRRGDKDGDNDDSKDDDNKAMMTNCDNDDKNMNWARTVFDYDLPNDITWQLRAQMMKKM